MKVSAGRSLIRLQPDESALVIRKINADFCHHACVDHLGKDNLFFLAYLIIIDFEAFHGLVRDYIQPVPFLNKSIVCGTPAQERTAVPKTSAFNKPPFKSLLDKMKALLCRTIKNIDANEMPFMQGKKILRNLCNLSNAYIQGIGIRLIIAVIIYLNTPDTVRTGQIEPFSGTQHRIMGSRPTGKTAARTAISVFHHPQDWRIHINVRTLSAIYIRIIAVMEPITEMKAVPKCLTTIQRTETLLPAQGLKTSGCALATPVKLPAIPTIDLQGYCNAVVICVAYIQRKGEGLIPAACLRH